MICQAIKLLSFVFIFQSALGEECKLEDNCRLVDIHGDVSPGHYRSIQECVDEMNPGDTCLIRSGYYHEVIMIEGKNNIVIRGDLDYDRPVIDGTIELFPKLDHDSDQDGIDDGNWKTETIDGHTVCVGTIEVKDDQHPFQLFLNKNGEREMMTNARWPNALWTDRDPGSGTPLLFYNKYWAKSDSTSERGKMVDKKVNGVSPLANSSLDVSGAMAILNVGSFNTFVKPVDYHKPGEDFFTYDDDFGNINFNPSHNQYYLDSAESLLDIPGEWYYNMNTTTLKFMPWDGKCPEANSGAVRGRITDYGMIIKNTDGVFVGDLDFFASNVYAVATSNNVVEINELYLDSINFKFPSSSRRMLQDFNVPKITKIVGKNIGTISIDNCEFYGGEGSALDFWGKDAKISNNLFQWNDWSGQMGLYFNGGLGTIYGENPATHEQFIGNTLWYNGASAGYRPGPAPRIKNNLIVGQCAGLLMNDGAGVQLQTGAYPYSIADGNWVFDSPKFAIRYDGSTSGAHHGTVMNNVIRNTGGFMIKGDEHNITGNMALPNMNKDSTSLLIITTLRQYPDIHNVNTTVENNAAWIADGGVDQFSTESGPWGKWPLAGIKSENYYGNNSYHGGEHWDGSWVYNGEHIPKPSIDLPDLLMDVDDFDFRPKPDTILTLNGIQIGPYPRAYSETTKYHIAGRKLERASHPIPSNHNVVPRKDALMFQPAYRCDKEGDKHLVYIVPENEPFPPYDRNVAEMNRDENIIKLSELDFTINPGETYQWRVDCVEGSSNKRRIGDVWQFTMT